MKYFTKEWHKISQQTSLHNGFHILTSTETFDEKLFERLYKNKERKHVNFQRELYNTDPRHTFPLGGYIPLEEIIDLSSIPDEHKITIYPSEQEIKQLEEAIVAFDNRPPFDEHLHKQEFSEVYKFNLDLLSIKYPQDILSQVADYRVFSLGYCTKKIYRQLKEQSKSNSKMICQIGEAALNERLKQHINEAFYREMRLHDCKVVDVIKGEHLVLKLDINGGYTSNNQITFIKPDILLEEGIINCIWIYDEIYRYEDGYELHVLLDGGRRLSELIVRFEELKIEQI